MGNIKIRDATIFDLKTLLHFEQMLINEERPFDNTLKPTNTSYYDFQEMLDNTDVKLVVAEINDEIISTGYARIKNAECFLTYKKFAFLGFMYVLPNWRGKGINKKIIQMLIKWSISRDINEVRLDVYYKNNAAINAYMKLGFINHVLEMRLPV
jgi:GNAT superfamily N-acetyltransferase